MKRLSIVLSILITGFISKGQTIPGPEEQKMTDAICECVSGIDFNVVKTKKQADKAFEDCFQKQLGLMMRVAIERKIEMTDAEAMSSLGVSIATQLLNNQCEAFLKLAVVMNNAEEDSDIEVFTGILKRVERDRYISFVLSDTDGKEISFQWLRRFPDSERFITESSKYIGKKLEVKWQSQEIFQSDSHNYSTVKEIREVNSRD